MHLGLVEVVGPLGKFEGVIKVDHHVDHVFGDCLVLVVVEDPLEIVLVDKAKGAPPEKVKDDCHRNLGLVKKRLDPINPIRFGFLAEDTLVNHVVSKDGPCVLQLHVERW